MFGSTNSIAAYQQVSIDSAVQSADPHRLILLLFQGAESAIGLARESIRQNNFHTKSQALSKAVDIISNGLSASIDLEQGGEIANKLSALYAYMTTRLLQANMKNDIAILDEVSFLLSEIRGAWEEIAPAP